MYNNEIAQKVLALLSNNPDKMFHLRDIASLIHTKKHQYRVLKDTLASLANDGRITRQNKLFSAARKKETPEKSRWNAPRDEENRKSPKDGKVLEGWLDAGSLARDHSFAFVITDEGDVFVDVEDTMNAFHKDKVLVEAKYRRGKRLYGTITKIVERQRKQIVGDIQRLGKKWILQPDDPKIHMPFNIQDPENLSEGKKAVLDVQDWGDRVKSRKPSGKISEILGESGNPEIEILAVIRRYELPLEFPPQVLEQLEGIEEDFSDISSRKDFRAIKTITIDPASAKDYDDAISLEVTSYGWKLYVHIADVAHYIPIASPLFQEALQRGNSYYFPRRVIPMIPEKLSNRICSLRPNEDKMTMTVVTEFDNRGHILNQEAYESVIKSDARLTYEEVDDLYEGKEIDLSKELGDMILEMRKLSRVLSANRDAKGCLYFDLPEVEFVYDNEGYLKKLERSSETESHKVIENFMLVANEYVAGILTQKANNTMYRIHEDPEEDSVRQVISLIKVYGLKAKFHKNLNRTLQNVLSGIEDRDFHRVFDRMILRSLKKAKYTTEHKGHFGLAIPTYTHFTSPIRRLCDLIVHHQMKMHVFKGGKAKFRKNDLKKYADVASDREILADESEREVNRVSKLHFMKKHVGEEYSAIVIAVNRNNIIVELDDMPVIGVIPIAEMNGNFRLYEQYMRLIDEVAGRTVMLMDRMTVRLDKVTDDIYFSPVQEAKS